GEVVRPARAVDGQRRAGAAGGLVDLADAGEAHRVGRRPGGGDLRRAVVDGGRRPGRGGVVEDVGELRVGAALDPDGHAPVAGGRVEVDVEGVVAVQAAEGDLVDVAGGVDDRRVGLAAGGQLHGLERPADRPRGRGAGEREAVVAAGTVHDQ